MMRSFLTSLALFVVVATEAIAQIQVQDYNYTQLVSTDGQPNTWSPNCFFGPAPYHFGTAYVCNVMNSDPDHSYDLQTSITVYDIDGDLVQRTLGSATIGPAEDENTPTWLNGLGLMNDFPIPADPDTVYYTEFHVAWNGGGFDATDFPMYELSN
jgi:hypothetical protein